MAEVTCKCGAVYERTGEQEQYRNLFRCEDCGREIESEDGVSGLKYKLIVHGRLKESDAG